MRRHSCLPLGPTVGRQLGHRDVHACQLVSHRGQYAVSGDLRQQRGGVFGRLGYLAFYLSGGLAATVLQTAVTLLFRTADDARVANLGASGAIAAVLGAYIALYPKARIFGLVGVIPFRAPAWLFLGFWFVLQLSEAISR